MAWRRRLRGLSDASSPLLVSRPRFNCFPPIFTRFGRSVVVSHTNRVWTLRIKLLRNFFDVGKIFQEFSGLQGSLGHRLSTPLPHLPSNLYPHHLFASCRTLDDYIVRSLEPSILGSLHRNKRANLFTHSCQLLRHISAHTYSPSAMDNKALHGTTNYNTLCPKRVELSKHHIGTENLPKEYSSVGNEEASPTRH